MSQVRISVRVVRKKFITSDQKAVTIVQRVIVLGDLCVVYEACVNIATEIYRVVKYTIAHCPTREKGITI